MILEGVEPRVLGFGPHKHGKAWQNSLLRLVLESTSPNFKSLGAEGSSQPIFAQLLAMGQNP